MGANPSNDSSKSNNAGFRAKALVIETIFFSPPLKYNPFLFNSFLISGNTLKIFSILKSFTLSVLFVIQVERLMFSSTVSSENILISSGE